METQKMSANLLSVYQKYKATHEVKALLSTRKKESSAALVFMHKGVYDVNLKICACFQNCAIKNVK